MKFKKILLFFLLSTLLSCGYKPLYNSDEYKFTIADYNLNGDKQITNILKTNFNKFKNYTDNNKILIINSDNSINKSILSKDTSGNATNFELKILISIEVTLNNEFLAKKTYSRNVNYNNLNSQFELKQYEKILITDLTNQIITEINYFLSNI